MVRHYTWSLKGKDPTIGMNITLHETLKYLKFKITFTLYIHYVGASANGRKLSTIQKYIQVQYKITYTIETYIQWRNEYTGCLP